MAIGNDYWYSNKVYNIGQSAAKFLHIRDDFRIQEKVQRLNVCGQE